MEFVSVLAGIGWDPEIRAILSVAVGVVVLCGSVYLLVATNTGARLGLLLAFTALFGWMSILTLYWWINPPGIGPKGESPSWQVEEVYVQGDTPPRTPAVQTLPSPDELPSAEAILAANPGLEDEFLGTPLLSDIAGVDPEVLPGRDDLGGWRIVSTGDAGEAQAVADEALVASGLFSDGSEFIRLNAFQQGGKQTRQDACDDDDVLCRIWYRLRITAQITHPTNYAVVQVQPVVYQEAVPGQAPPTPIADETQPVVSVVLVRDLGSERALPAIYFVISFALFVMFALILHYRDKTLQQNLAAAEAVKAGK